MAGDFPRLTDVKVAELDEIDKALRTKARRDGHRHPIAVGSATTRNGKKVGFAVR